MEEPVKKIMRYDTITSSNEMVSFQVFSFRLFVTKFLIIFSHYMRTPLEDTQLFQFRFLG